MVSNATCIGEVTQWDAKGRNPKVLFQGLGRINALALHPDHDRIAIARADGSPQMLWLTQARNIKPIGHRNEVNHVQFSADGSWLVSGGDDGTVRLWDANTGQPIWHAVALLSAPSRLFSHKGWSTLQQPQSKPVQRSQPTHEQAIESRGRVGYLDPSTHTLCLLTASQKLELWHTKLDELTWSIDAPELTNLVPYQGGCLFTTPLGVQFVDAKARVHNFANTSNARSISPHPKGVVVSQDAQVHLFESGNFERPAATHVMSTGITNAVLDQETNSIIVGFSDGSIEAHPTSKTDGTKTRLIDQKVSAAVTHLLLGDHDLLIAGYANGRVRLLNQSSGRTLSDVRLHGGIRFLRFENGYLEAVSDLGQSRRWHIAALELSPCELTRNVRRKVPVQGVQGQPVAIKNPTSSVDGHCP